MENSKSSREDLFEKLPVWNAIFKLTIPTIIGSIIAMVYNLSDTYFVGMLDDSIQNAAVTLAAPAMTLFYAITNLFGVGASSLLSRALGKKDYTAAKKAAATGIYFGLFFAAVLSFVTIVFNKQTLLILGTDVDTYKTTKKYLFYTVCLGSIPSVMTILFGYLIRAEGKSMQASFGQMMGCVINIILDPIFILPFGLNLGVAGAGLATFISNCIACTYFLVYLVLKRKNTLVCLKPNYVSFEKGILLSILIVGIPGVFQNFLNVLSMTVLNNQAKIYGADTVAAIGIANKINQLPIQIVFGFTQGVMPLIGYNYACKNIKRMNEAIKKTLTLTISALCVITICFFFYGEGLVSLFMNKPVIVSVGGQFLRGLGLGLPFMCVDFMIVGITQSFGIGKYALIFSFLRKLIFEIPLIIGLNLMFKANGMAFAQCITEILMCIITAMVYHQLSERNRTLLRA